MSPQESKVLDRAAKLLEQIRRNCKLEASRTEFTLKLPRISEQKMALKHKL